VVGVGARTRVGDGSVVAESVAVAVGVCVERVVAVADDVTVGEGVAVGDKAATYSGVDDGACVAGAYAAGAAVTWLSDVSKL
jgi:UDP-3-O-[3-hydroxymyristoyl] glucosamine N-acyltransferase